MQIFYCGVWHGNCALPVGRRFDVSVISSSTDTLELFSSVFFSGSQMIATIDHAGRWIAVRCVMDRNVSFNSVQEVEPGNV
jgi:hypothetical protein